MIMYGDCMRSTRTTSRTYVMGLGDSILRTCLALSGMQYIAPALELHAPSHFSKPSRVRRHLRRRRSSPWPGRVDTRAIRLQWDAVDPPVCRQEAFCHLFRSRPTVPRRESPIQRTCREWERRGSLVVERNHRRSSRGRRSQRTRSSPGRCAARGRRRTNRIHTAVAAEHAAEVLVLPSVRCAQLYARELGGAWR